MHHLDVSECAFNKTLHGDHMVTSRFLFPVFLLTAISILTSCNRMPDVYGSKYIPTDSASTTSSESGFRDDLWLIAHRFYAGDSTALYEVFTWEDALIVLEYLAQMHEADTGVRPDQWHTGLPDCTDVVGEYQVSVWADASLGMSAAWEPACFMQDRWALCGGGTYNMVGFSIGVDPVLTDRYFVWGSTTWSQAVLLLSEIFHQEHETNTRLYSAPEEGFAYVCLDTMVNPGDITLSL